MTALLARAENAPPADSRRWGQFRIYWFGHLLSYTGDWFTILALPLIAKSEYSDVTNVGLYVGVVAAAELIATPLVGMRLASWADRWDPRRTMVASNVIQAAMLAGLAWWVATTRPPLWVLPVAAFVLSALRDLHDSAESIMVVSVVPDSMLVRANGRFQISDGAGHVVGALIAGAVALTSPTTALAIDAASFALSALAVIAMGRFRVHRPDTGPEPAWRSTIRALRSEDRYWRIVLMMAVANIATACVLGPFVLFADEVLDLNEAQIGATWAAMGVGGFIAGVLLDRVQTLRPRAALGATATLAIGIGVTGVAGSWPVTIVAFAAVGAALAVGMATVGSMRHASFPAHLQGRVTVATRIAFTAGVAPGVVAAGWLADLPDVGPAKMFVIFAFAAAFATGVGFVYRLDRLPAPSEPWVSGWNELTDEDAAFWAEPVGWRPPAPSRTPDVDLTDRPIELPDTEPSDTEIADTELRDTETHDTERMVVLADIAPRIEPEVASWDDQDPFALIALALTQPSETPVDTPRGSDDPVAR